MSKNQRKVFAVLTAVFMLIPPGIIVQASSHREAPSITLDPTADNTDLYVFRSTEAGRGGFVTMITNFIPLEGPAGGPNFHKFDPNVLYEIMIDNNGDTREDITYQFRFRTEVQNGNTFLNGTGPITSLTDPDYNVRQTYTVTRVVGNRRFGTRETLGSGLLAPPPNFGPGTSPNYEQLADAAIHTLSDGSRVFAGPRDEGFYVDLGAIFDLLQLRKPPGNAGGGVDGTGGLNVHSIAIEVPISRLTRDGSIPASATDPAAVIGVWSTASRPFITILPPEGGPPEAVNFPFGTERWVQVSRLGNPLVNEVVIPLRQKDRFNASHPIGDSQFLSFVTSPELATLFNALFGVPVPPPPRNDLVHVFLTGVPGLNQPPNVVPSEQMRLNLAIAPAPDASRSRFGVLGGDLAGYPNGRRVGDDVTDISFRAVAGVLAGGTFAGSPNKDLGDGVDVNDVPYLTKFPYLGTPHDGKGATRKFGLLLQGAQETPPVNTSATGTAYVTLNTAANTLSYRVEFSGLSANETGAHIHCCAARGAAAGVRHPLQPPGPGSPKVGTWTYDEADEAAILGGLTYFNVHSTNNPGGEIRGQIEPIPRP